VRVQRVRCRSSVMTFLRCRLKGGRDGFEKGWRLGATPTASARGSVLRWRAIAAYDYNVTIWCPSSKSAGDTNCALLPALGYKEPLYTWCISIGQNSFIVAQPIPMQGQP